MSHCRTLYWFFFFFNTCASTALLRCSLRLYWMGIYFSDKFLVHEISVYSNNPWKFLVLLPSSTEYETELSLWPWLQQPWLQHACFQWKFLQSETLINYFSTATAIPPAFVHTMSVICHWIHQSLSMRSSTSNCRRHCNHKRLSCWGISTIQTSARKVVWQAIGNLEHSWNALTVTSWVE